ncbi:uncharacterized protein LOC128199149 [Bicyclus anynana]|uniref:ribonuclease H n=1 Tax=Bicyclus anynana TaxID=110368 RepID=A0ABM3LW16_BICAN|nr:uncharacterized protein LOC128199149 [Bicyclus anynana]
MHYLSIWLSEHGLTLSASKSKAVIFTRKRTIPDLEIRYEDQIIQMDSSAKFLGVIFDSKLTGSQHFSYIAEKSEKGVNIIRALSGVWWGSHPYCQKLLYNALIRSHFDYGSFIFEPCNKEGLEKLNLVQTKCLRIIVGAMKSSPNAALMVECVDPPLDLRRQYLSDWYVSKLIQVSSHPLLPYLDSLSHKVNIDNYWVNKDPPRLVRSYRRCKALPQPISQSPAPPIFNCSFDALIFKPNVLLDLGISKNDREANRKLYQVLGEKWMGWTIIFTDASRLTTNGNVGSAVWIPKYNVVLLFKNPCQTSVFTGEAIAIHEAVQYAKSHSLTKILILSDSKSCLQAISGNIFKSSSNSSQIIINIKEALHYCCVNNFEIALAWIPGHSGISGNEQADLWAKEAVQSGLPTYSSIYCSDILPLAKTYLFRMWSRRWNELTKGKHYRNIQPDIPCKPWFFKFKHISNKRTTSVLCRLRLGHVCTPVFLNKIRV